MNRIAKKWAELKEKKHRAFSCFLTLGYPDKATTLLTVKALDAAGVDFFELGFPFSDPIADGPTIQKSSDVALRQGLKWNDALKMISELRQSVRAPLLLMTYANILFTRGWKRSVKEMCDAGIDGFIIPDMTEDAAGDLIQEIKNRNADFISLVAPTTSAARLKKICARSSGFIYAVSVLGVTGSRNQLPESAIKKFLKTVQLAGKLPVMLGFGISAPEQCVRMGSVADGFIVGSRLVEVLSGSTNAKARAARVREWVRPFLKAVHS